MKKNLPQNDVEFLSRRDHVFRELASESDRGVVLVGAALLEENLEIVLRSVMRRDDGVVKKVIDSLFQGDGGFATFSAKIKSCYALNLIDEKAFKDLETIRAIRNEFAHSYQTASFASQATKDRVDSLWSGKVFEADLENPNEETTVTFEAGKPGVKLAAPKRRFIVSVAFLSSHLEGHARGFVDVRDKTGL